MKRQILIILILLSSILTINAQTRVPNDGISPLWYNNGNIGIGTGIAGSLLTLENPNSPTIEFKTSGTSDLLISGYSASTIINSLRSNPIYFQINSGTVMTVAGTGNIGIGTTNPTGLLHLHSSTAVLTMTYPENGYSAIRGLNGTWIFGYGGSSGEENISIGTQDGTGSRTLIFAAGGQARMKILSNGNIGIKTNLPAYELDVNGTIHAREVKVDLNFPADYVFKSDYKLMSLREVEQFIKANSHLPEIPSATEIKENGLNMGDMQNKLLRKIEEMTLYMIEQNKITEQQSNTIEELKQLVKLQSEKIEKLESASK